MYLDDCIVYMVDDQFLERLELADTIPGKKNIPKPSKCKFGTPRVEYGRLFPRRDYQCLRKR
jgi:hypothetical protein